MNTQQLNEIYQRQEQHDALMSLLFFSLSLWAVITGNYAVAFALLLVVIYYLRR